MAAIDADAHVIETTATFGHLSEADREHLPGIVSQIFGNEARNNAGQPMREFWVVDGVIHGKDRNVGLDTPRESREMSDVAARLRHMDALGIDVQVLYPTLFLRPIARSFQSEAALVGAYNRWLADIWSQGGGRLRWVVMPALQSMHEIRAQLEFGREHGACGVFMRGLECDLPLAHPYFFPLYEAAQELDLPICIHSANGSIVHKLTIVGALHSLIEKAVPAEFPRLRWGFIEASAQWVPYVLNDLEDRFRRAGKPFFDAPLAENNMYVACEVTDDLPYVLRHAGEDNLVVGTDYGHHDPSAEIDAIQLIREDARVPPHVRRKILEANPRALYGLR
ncbi:MAG: amidohydrolase family protein [Defluviicoccus sp.]|nr:amidohydrolase family protein [Defluviicoccus sp.]